MKYNIVVFITWVFLTGISQSADYYVSISGNDASAGSDSDPWLTIGHASATATAGDTVIVRAGVYQERVVFPNSGAAGEMIVFRSEVKGGAVIDGSSITPSGFSGLLEINSKSYLRIEGFVIRNYTSSLINTVPIGILIQGSGTSLEITENLIENIASTATVSAAKLGRDAHGMAVYGNLSQPIEGLIVKGNELKNLTLGSSEAMVLNGNVSGFKVVGNHVHNCDNIGIDFIGFEGTATGGGIDQARNGLVMDNLVHDITSAGNPAYGSDTSAGGIYVDGGKDIIIDRNHVYRCDIGIEVASEHSGRTTERVKIRSNLIRENLMGGIFIGGYDGDNTGSADGCEIINNTLYNNDTVQNGSISGQICIQDKVTNTVISNNILYHSILKDSAYNAFIIMWNETGSNITINHNLYFGTATPVWVISDQWLEGWITYQNNAISGPNEAWGDPIFKNVVAIDFSITAGSPAIDTGDNATLAADLFDFSGNIRRHGIAVDRGAFESGSAKPEKVAFKIEKVSGALQLTWAAVDGRLVEIQRSEDLKIWITVPGFDLAPKLGIMSVQADLQKEFFRIREY